MTSGPLVGPILAAPDRRVATDEEVRAVLVAGGASVVDQALTAGPVDEVDLHVAPVRSAAADACSTVSTAGSRWSRSPPCSRRGRPT